MKLTFKRLSERWFIDIPWDGSVDDLEMVGNAAIFLNNLPQISPDIIVIELNDTGPYILNKKQSSDYIPENWGGATYDSEQIKDIWLCPVTLDVLGEYPETIKFKVII